MSGEWTYQTPDSKLFLRNIIYYLKTNKQNRLAEIFSKGKVEFNVTNTFGYRNYSFRTNVHFRLPTPFIEEAEKIIFDNLLERDIVIYCSKCTPPEAGFDIDNFEIMPLLDSYETDVFHDVENTVNELPQSVQDIIIPDDFRDKMHEMTPLYSSIYIIENILRLFVVNVLVERFGNDNLSNINLNNKQKDRIKERKTKERKKKWMRSRGSSEIFYLDFSDFSYIIENNWSVFKAYSPDVKWITQKLDELSDCRNIIAHTSYLGDNEKEAIKLYFKLIVDQIKDRI